MSLIFSCRRSEVLCSLALTALLYLCLLCLALFLFLLWSRESSVFMPAKRASAFVSPSWASSAVPSRRSVWHHVVPYHGVYSEVFVGVPSSSKSGGGTQCIVFCALFCSLKKVCLCLALLIFPKSVVWKNFLGSIWFLLISPSPCIFFVGGGVVRIFLVCAC